MATVSRAPDTAPATITAGTAESYVFNHPVGTVVIGVDSDYTGKLKVMFDQTASSTVWRDAAPLEGGATFVKHGKTGISRVSIYAENADATLGTDFSVGGW